MSVNRRFIHIPKTGGTSVINYMIEHGIDCEWGGALGDGHLPRKKHAPASYWHAEPTEKFAVIRHPATRLVSFFQYCRTHFGAYRDCSFREFLRYHLRPDCKRRLTDPWLDQCHWLLHKDRIIVSTLLRLETLELDLHAYLGDFGPVPRLNTTSAVDDDLMSWYSDKDLRRVQKVFARDYEVLGYK